MAHPPRDSLSSSSFFFALRTKSVVSSDAAWRFPDQCRLLRSGILLACRVMMPTKNADLYCSLPLQNSLRTELSTGRRDSGRTAATLKLTATAARIDGGRWVNSALTEPERTAKLGCAPLARRNRPKWSPKARSTAVRLLKHYYRQAP